MSKLTMETVYLNYDLLETVVPKLMKELKTFIEK